MSSNWYTERVDSHTRFRKYDHRTEYEKDRTNIVHSFAFRRLQGKFQMITPSESDFHRTRLTHSIEVASIAKNIFLNIIDREQKHKADIEKLNWLNEQKDADIISLLEAISLMHDIGHSAFGHAGEVALNYMMRNYGGFESNAETLNIYKYKGLTKRCLLGILKYPVPYSQLCRVERPEEYAKNRFIQHEDWEPPKCYYDEDQEVVDIIFDNFTENEKKEFQSTKPGSNNKSHLETKYKSFDCSLMEIADDIGYTTHDLEDALFYQLIDPEKIEKNLGNKIKNLDKSGVKMFEELFNVTKNQMDDRSKIRKQIGNLVHYFIINSQLSVNDRFDEEVLKYNVVLDDPIKSIVESLKNIISEEVIHSQEIQTIIHGDMLVLMQLFEAIESNPKELLSPKDFKKYSKQQNDASRKRIICGNIAGMTDDYAYRMHARLYGHNTRNMFEKL